MNSRSIEWNKLKDLISPNTPNIRYRTSDTEQIKTEIRRILREQRQQRLDISEVASLRRSRIRQQLDNLTPNTRVYRFTGNAFDDRKTIDIDDQGLVKAIIRKLNLNNARVLFYVKNRLIKQITYRRTSGRKFATKVFADWIEGNYDTGDNITIFRDALNEDVVIEDLTLIIQPTSSLKSLKIKQRFLDGGLIHCVFDPLIKWYNEKLSKTKSNRNKQLFKRGVKICSEYKEKHKDGATTEILRELVDKLRINIIIKSVFSIVNTVNYIKDKINEGCFIRINSKNKSKINFEYTNTRVNHLEIANDRYLSKNPVLLKSKDMELKFKELVDKDKFPLFHQNDKKEYLWISTIDEYYKLDSETNKIYDKFYKDVNFNSIDSNSKISNLIRESVHITGQHNIKYPSYIKGFKRIDQEKAYANFNKCSYYQGIMNTFTDYRIVAIVREKYKEFLLNHIGIYRVENFDYSDCNDNTKKIFNRMKIYNNSSFTSPELIFLLDNKVKFNICYGAWGVKAIDFEFPNYMYERENEKSPRWYAKIVGSIASYNSNKIVQMYGEKKWAEHLKTLTDASGNSYDIKFNEDYKWIEENESEVDKNEGCIRGIITTEFKKKKITHKNHIASFITSYARISLLEQLFDINYNDIYAIITDEIVIKKFSVFDLRSYFREKNNNKSFSKYYPSSFISYYNLKYKPPTAQLNMYSNNRIVCHIGAGGCGKTYNLCKDDGYVNIIYTAPSHKLRKVKESEFFDRNLQTEVIYNIINDPVYSRKYKINKPSIIIIDEATQLSEEQLKKVNELYPESKILLAGDFDKDGFIYQLPCFEGTKLDISSYKKVTYNNNRRVKDDKLKKILLHYRKLRKCWDKIMTKEGILQFINRYLKDRIIKVDKVFDLYTIDDYVLCGTRNTKKGIKEWNKKLKKKGNKYLIIKNSKDYSKGEVCNDNLKGRKFAEYRHAFTCHQIQGETIKSNIFIDFNNIFDMYRMFYVAMSRAEYLDKIFIIL